MFFLPSLGTTKNITQSPVFISLHMLMLCLYKRDCRRRFTPTNHWLIHEVKPSTFISDLEKGKRHAVILLQKMPHIIPHEDRVKLFRKFVQNEKAVLGLTESACASPRSALIVVHRERIVEDGYRQLAALKPHALKVSSRIYLEKSIVPLYFFFLRLLFRVSFEYALLTSKAFMRPALTRMVFSKSFWKRPLKKFLIHRLISLKPPQTNVYIPPPSPMYKIIICSSLSLSVVCWARPSTRVSWLMYPLLHSFCLNFWVKPIKLYILAWTSCHLWMQNCTKV